MYGDRLPSRVGVRMDLIACRVARQHRYREEIGRGVAGAEAAPKSGTQPPDKRIANGARAERASDYGPERSMFGTESADEFGQEIDLDASGASVGATITRPVPSSQRLEVPLGRHRRHHLSV